MNIRTSSKSSLFLIELVIILLVFAVASAICVSLFATARLATRESVALSEASARCENAVEALRAGNEALLLETAELRKTADGYAACYNEDWIPVSESGSFLLEITLRDAGNGLTQVTACVTDIADGGSEEVYTLEAAVFAQ